MRSLKWQADTLLWTFASTWLLVTLTYFSGYTRLKDIDRHVFQLSLWVDQLTALLVLPWYLHCEFYFLGFFFSLFFSFSSFSVFFLGGGGFLSFVSPSCLLFSFLWLFPVHCFQALSPLWRQPFVSCVAFFHILLLYLTSLPFWPLFLVTTLFLTWLTNVVLRFLSWILRKRIIQRKKKDPTLPYDEKVYQ